MNADELRSAVVEAAREMLRLGLVSGSSGNASARDGDKVLITWLRRA
jgi:ribulose-5-phosphate 4-epimerase/fuculose-1-phosphate aldolase